MFSVLTVNILLFCLAMLSLFEHALKGMFPSIKLDFPKLKAILQLVTAHTRA